MLPPCAPDFSEIVKRLSGKESAMFPLCSLLHEITASSGFRTSTLGRNCTF